MTDSLSDNVVMLSNDPRYRRGNDRTSRPKKTTVRFMIPGKPVYTCQVQLPVTPEVGTTFPFRQSSWRVIDCIGGEYCAEPVGAEAASAVEPETGLAAPPAEPPSTAGDGAGEELAEPRAAGAASIEVRLYPTSRPDRLLVCWDGDGAVVTGLLTPRSREFADAKRRLDEALGGPSGYRLVGDDDPAQPRMALARRRALEMAKQCAALSNGGERQPAAGKGKARRSRRGAGPRRPGRPSTKRREEE